MSNRRWIALATLVLFAGPSPAEDLGRFAGSSVARLSVTLDPDASGSIPVPSPFCVIPGTQRVAIFVPAADGVLTLRGSRILHHFPLPVSEVHGLEVGEGLLVAGRRPAVGRVTVDLEIFDLREKADLERVQSANPYLRIESEGFDLWRVLVEGGTVGVYHPPAGASYPLWVLGDGVVPSTEQMANASPGIGWGRPVSWVPHPDGTVVRTERGRSKSITTNEVGDFIDVVSDSAVLLAQPETRVRSDADGEALLAREQFVRIVDVEGTKWDFRLETVSPDVRASRLAIQGRGVRVRDDHLYWIYVGYDYLEIRKLPLASVFDRQADFGSR